MRIDTLRWPQFCKYRDMDPIYQTRFSSALLTAVFGGLAATILCMVYYLVFKEVTGFPLSLLINVSSLIFIINILFVVIGLIYSFFLQFSKKGEIQYMVLFFLITVLLIVLATRIHRVSDLSVNHEFQELLIGLIVIIGISAAFVIPLLFHSKKFQDTVL